MTEPVVVKPSRWQNGLAWAFLAVVVCDFIIFPIAWAAYQGVMKITPITPWSPLTLQGSGLFYLAMGGILGAHVWRLPNLMNWQQGGGQ